MACRVSAVAMEIANVPRRGFPIRTRVLSLSAAARGETLRLVVMRFLSCLRGDRRAGGSPEPAKPRFSAVLGGAGGDLPTGGRGRFAVVVGSISPLTN